jgi:hypothetical protein
MHIASAFGKCAIDRIYRMDRMRDMNGFALHHIDHLSPSSLALAQAELALWVQERLLKKRGPVGCAAHRGTGSEKGVAAGLLDPKLAVEDCEKIALLEFDRLTALSSDTRKQKERDAIPGIVRTALAELRLYGIPKCQGKIVHKFDDVPVPVLGFYDFLFESCGILVDLKTQLRLSSEISTSHARQVGFYVHGTNLEGRVCYTTDKRIGVYRLENPAEHVAALCNIARRLNRFLSISADPLELAALVMPNPDSFYYSDSTTRALCRETYGL